MPARRFTRANIRWRACEHCGGKFPDSRKNRRFCGDSCREMAWKARRRLKAIQAKGGQCSDCGTKFDPAYSSRKHNPFYVLLDGTVVCGVDFSRRSREKFHKRWPRGKKGYIQTSEAK